MSINTRFPSSSNPSLQKPFNVNDVYYEGKMIQCNYLLRWQLSSGEIIKRWANIVSASKYDVGENGNNTLVLSSNNYAILIGFCNEGFELEGKRVFIDMNPICRSSSPDIMHLKSAISSDIGGRKEGVI